MFPTPYSDLNWVLGTLVTRIEGILGRTFVGAYLQGSFAVGDFDRYSDVDYIIVIEDELTLSQVAALQVMHDQVYQLESSWAQHLEGSYFPRHILKDTSHQGIPLWYLDNGARTLIRSNHCNTVLVRWVVREKGIALAGPPPASLVDPVPTDLLRADIYTTIVHWGQEILDHPERFNNRFYQSFIVLSYCRMLHDLIAGSAGSKRTGAAWAKQNLDPSWQALIDRTWDGRPKPEVSVRQPADPGDFALTLKFVRHIIHEAEAYAANHGTFLSP